MKLIVLSLFSVLSAGSLSAQRHAEAQASSPGMQNEWASPGILSRTDDSSIGKPAYINDINISAVRDFAKRFSADATPQWLRLPNGDCLARFSKDGIANRVAYSPRGSWVYTLSSYPEKLMSRSIRHLVKSEYYDYSITGVFEVKQYNVEGPVYFIYMRDEKEYLTLQIYDGEIIVKEKLLKANRD